MGFDQWDDEAKVTAEEATHADGLKHVINTTLNTDCCAVLDRNDQNDEWRKVFLRRDADDSWTLHDENGNLLDEPDSGCPGTGFTTASILDDVGLEYYQVATLPPPPRPEPGGGAAPDALVVLDLKRGRLKEGGETGTLREREASKDHVLPAHKVAFILDNGGGAHRLIKRDDVQHQVEFMDHETDPVPATMRAARFMRSGSTM